MGIHQGCARRRHTPAVLPGLAGAPLKSGAERDFPGPVVKNPPSNAGDVGSTPDRGTKIPHAEGQLSQHATTTEPERSRARATTREPTHHNERFHMRN